MENLLGIDDSLLDAKVTQEALDFNKEVPQLAPQGFEVNIEKTPNTFATGDNGVSRVVNKPKQVVTKDTNRPSPDPLFSAISDATQDHYNRQANDIVKVSSYNPNVKERYKKDASLYHDYFDPKSDNERVAYENWDKWDAISAGLGRFKDSFSSSYKEAAYTWVRAGKALFNGDVDYLSPSAAENEREAYNLERMDIENPIFYKPGTEDDFLTKGFLVETMGNLGFTFGTIGEVITEQVVTKAIEGGLALLAPATGGSSLVAAGQLETVTAASTGLKLGKLWKNMVKMFTGRALNTTEHLVQAGDKIGDFTKLKFPPVPHNPFVGGDVATVLRTVNQAETTVTNGIKYGEGFWDNALQLATYVPFAGELAQSARIAKAGKNVLNSTELFRVGVGGLRRSFAEWQMAAGEAAIEAGGNYADLYNQFKDEFRQRNNGQEAIGEDLLKIKKLALESATLDFGSNIAILGITNKIQWGNIVGNFGFESKAINAVRNSLAKEASELGITVVEGIGKKTGKALTQGYEKGLMGTLGLLPKIASDFSAKQAAWEYGKSMLRGLTRIELSEGLQENFQEMASIRLKDYYTDIYRGDPADWGKSFNEAVNSQISKQGLKTFLSGALTGVFIGPAMNVIKSAQTSKFLNPAAAAHRESVRKSLQQINTYFNGGSDTILKEAVKQIKLQTQYNDGMLEGILNKDKYQHGNNYDSALIQTIMHAKRTGTLGYLISHIKGYEEFSNDQFKQAFGFSPEDIEKGSTTQDVMGGIATSVEAYSEIWDKYQDKYSLLLDVEDLIEDPARRQKFSVRKAALMDAIGTVAFIESKSKSSIKRAAGIKERLGKYDSIGNSLHTAWNTITNPESIDDSILSLRNQIKTIREGVPEGQKMDEKTERLLRDKEMEFVLLSEVRKNVFTDMKIEDPNNPGNYITVTQARFIDSNKVNNSKSSPMGTINYVAQAIGAYLSLKNKQAGLSTVVNKDEVENAAIDIYQYMALGQDHAEYVDAVNLLNDPDNFGKYYQNIMDARAAAHARLLYDSYMKLGGISEVAKRFLEENKGLTDELLQFSKSPMGTFDNMIIIQDLANKLNQKFDEFELERIETDKKEQENKLSQEEEKAKRAAKAAQSRIPLPVITLLEQAIETPEKAAEIMSQVNEYMAMRFNLEELETKFPYNSTDPKERAITRYFLNAEGAKEVLNQHTVPVSYKVQVVDESTGEVTVEEIPINSYESLYSYLENLEQSYYNAYLKKQEKSTKETAAKTEALDVAKSDLDNFIGQKVVLSGNMGTLEIEGGKYIVRFDDGSRPAELAFVGNTTVTFNDFANLSLALESLPEDQKEVLTSKASPVVEVTDAGAFQIVMDSNLQSIEINGVTWDIEFGPNGLATGFTRTYKKAKKVSRRFKKGEKIITERLAGNNPKTKEYLALVNNILMNVVRPLPSNEVELTQENEAYDIAINEAKATIEKEAMTKQRSDELVAQYQVNAMKNQEIPDDILKIKWIFDNPLRRDELTSEERIKLYIWASDLVNQIKKHFRIWTTNKFVNSAITELEKEYINPISELDNAAIKPGSKTVTDRSSTKKERTQKPTEGGITPEGRRDTSESEAKSGKKKRGKGGITKAVNQIEMQFDGQIQLDFNQISTPTGVADPVQTIIAEENIEQIFEITPSRLQAIQSAIPRTTPTPEVISEVAPISTDAKADVEKRRQELTTFSKNRKFIKGIAHEIQIQKKFNQEGFDVDVSNKANTSTGFLYSNALSEHFDTLEEAIEYANQVIQGDKEYIKKVDAELAAQGKPAETKSEQNRQIYEKLRDEGNTRAVKGRNAYYIARDGSSKPAVTNLGVVMVVSEKGFKVKQEDGTLSEWYNYSYTKDRARNPYYMFSDSNYTKDVAAAQPKETSVVDVPIIEVTDPLEQIGEEMRSLYEKIQMEEMMAEAQTDETIPELKVLRYMPKILPASAKAETGVKTGTKSDISISMLSKKGVTVQQAAHNVMEHFQSEGDYNLNEEEIRDIIIDILVSGSKSAYEAQFKGSPKELKQLKAELKQLEDKYNRLANPDQRLIDNPFQALINKSSCEI
jgi:hypothetical protein